MLKNYWDSMQTTISLIIGSQQVNYEVWEIYNHENFIHYFLDKIDEYMEEQETILLDLTQEEK